MKKKILVTSLIATLLCSCNNKQQKEIEKKDHQLSIFVTSDTHLLSNNLIGENNQLYLKKYLTVDGRVQEYDYELVEAFVNEINDKKPDLAVITGDLSYNGEFDSHKELVRLLDKIKDTKLLVIPGNHDMYNLSPVSFINDKNEIGEAIDAKMFKKLYANYGYSNAYSYDEASLSYIYEINKNTWALMLDTTISRYNDDYGSTLTSGQLEESTLSWMEENLKYAKENNIEVVSFTHHNLTNHNPSFTTRYTLYNNQDVLELYSKYQVKMNFSGHLHIQNIASEVTSNNKLYDICSESLLDYGNKYGRFDIYSNAYEYQTIKLDTGIDNFDEYSFNTFYCRHYNKNIESNINKYGENLGTKISELNALRMTYYFDGNYDMVRKLYNENKSIFRKTKQTKTTFYSKMSEENQNYLLIERN